MKQEEKEPDSSQNSPPSPTVSCPPAEEPAITVQVDWRHPNVCAPVECSGEHSSPAVKHGDHLDYHVGHAHHHRHGDHCDLHGCC